MAKQRRHIPTAVHRKAVALMVFEGMTRDDISRVTGIGLYALDKHYREELQTGFTKIKADLVRSAYEMAVGCEAKYDEAGRVVRSEQKRVASMLQFVLERRLGWTLPKHGEDQSDKAVPIDVKVLTDEELLSLQRIAKRSQSAAAGSNPSRDGEETDGSGQEGDG